MSGIWQQESGGVDGTGVHPQIITWSCCTKDKMVAECLVGFFYINDKTEFEYFYFYPSLLFSPPALTNVLLLLSQAAGGCVTLAVPGPPGFRTWLCSWD